MRWIESLAPVLGNLDGFPTVLTLTGPMPALPLHTTFTIPTGLGCPRVQSAAARLLFREAASLAVRIGAARLARGMLLIRQR